MYEIIKMNNSPRRRFIKRAARKMLFSDWLMHILAFLIVGSCVVAINHFGTSLALIVNDLTDNILLLEAILFFYVFFSLLFTVPLLYGLVSLEANAIAEEKVSLIGLFSAFSDMKGVLRSYSLFLQALGRLIPCFVPAIAVFVFKEFFYEDFIYKTLYIGGIDVIMFLLNTVFVLLIYLGTVLFSGTFVAIYLTVTRRYVSVDECFYKAKFFIMGNRGEISKVALSFLPLFVISLFSIGFLFLLYTLPYMLITLLMTAKYICDKHLYSTAASHDASQQISE